MSTNALKIILQILNVFFLVVAAIVIGFGIFALASPNSIKDMFPTQNPNDAKNFDLVLLVVGWICLAAGLLSLLLQVFGIYAVSKEHAGKVKTYGTIHLVLLVLNIINCIFKFNFGSLALNLIFSGAIVYLSYELAKRFREKTTNELTPPPYNFAPSYKV